jgi:hypothetical protein
MLVSKIQTYLSDKMHLKSYYKKNMLNWDLHQKWRVFVITFFRCSVQCTFSIQVIFWSQDLNLHWSWGRKESYVFLFLLNLHNQKQRMRVGSGCGKLILLNSKFALRAPSGARRSGATLARNWTRPGSVSGSAVAWDSNLDPPATASTWTSAAAQAHAQPESNASTLWAATSVSPHVNWDSGTRVIRSVQCCQKVEISAAQLKRGKKKSASS